MKKRYITIILAAVLSGGLTSCNDWLDVEQNTEKKAEHMFETYDGFKGALSGCYSDLIQSSLYGTKLTITDIEGLSSLWILDVGNSNYDDEMRTTAYFREHDYSHDLTEKAIRNIYAAFYNTIMEANMIIRAIPEYGRNIPDAKSRAVVEGEAYAIRALCQLDILRLFGQLPVGASKQVELPYSEIASIDDPVNYYSFEAYVKKLEADFDKAASLLKENDPVCTYTLEQLNNVGTEKYEDVKVNDDFMQSRQYRMNYWAVRALQARMYMYLGQTGKAHDIALEVINATTPDGKKVATLSSNTDYGFPPAEESVDHPRQYASPSESLFGVYMKDLSTLNKSLFGDTDPNSSAWPDRTYLMPEKMWEDLFSGLDKGTDVRMLYEWQNVKDLQKEPYYMLMKYAVKESGMIPIIRLSEVYLIAVEGAPSLEEANRLYTEYLKSKNSIAPTYASVDALKAELEKEYRREFFGEGQLFFYYKRNNTKRIWSNEDADMQENDYILPLPNTEFNSTKK